MEFPEWWDSVRRKLYSGLVDPMPYEAAELAWKEAYRQGRLDAEAHFREQLEKGE